MGGRRLAAPRGTGKMCWGPAPEMVSYEMHHRLLGESIFPPEAGGRSRVMLPDWLGELPQSHSWGGFRSTWWCLNPNYWELCAWSPQLGRVHLLQSFLSSSCCWTHRCGTASVSTALSWLMTRLPFTFPPICPKQWVVKHLLWLCAGFIHI